MSFKMKVINRLLKLSVKPILSLVPINKHTISIPRKTIQLMTSFAPKIGSCKITDIVMNGVSAEQVELVKGRAPKFCKVLMYLHGGGYLVGSPLTHRNITSRLAHLGDCSVFAIDYRKSPEHKYPAALDDSVVSYQWLLDQGYKPENIVIAGDSAGGNLTLVTTLALRDRGLPLPAGIVCISPWTDMTCSGESYITRKDVEPMIPPHKVKDAANMYIGNVPAHDPRVSPLFADYEGMPPMLIHVGDHEILLHDSINLHIKAKQHGVDSDIKIWKEAPHVFQIFAGLAPQSSQALKEIAWWMKDKWS